MILSHRGTLSPRGSLHHSFDPVYGSSPLVRCQVWAEHPVYAYLADGLGLYTFQQHRDFESLAGEGTAVKQHTLTAALPRGAEWHLLIVNDTDLAVPHYWEIKRL